jgi:hypothetical protein
MNYLIDEADDYKMWADWSPRSKRQPVSLRILASAAVVATSALLISGVGFI